MWFDLHNNEYNRHSYSHHHLPPIMLVSEEQSFPSVFDVNSSVYFPYVLGKTKLVYVLWVTIPKVISMQSPHSDPC